MENDVRLKRLRYRSWHRGWKETDLVLGHFADENLEKMDSHTIDIYERLLDENDADIWDWLVGKLPPKNPDYMLILEALKEYSKLAEKEEQRKIGIFKGKINIPDNFDEPMPDEWSEVKDNDG